MGNMGKCECGRKEISDVAKNPLQRTCMNVKLIWILSEGHLKLLEAFQGEMAKQILQLPKQFSNTAAVTALDWPSGRVELLVRKLSCSKRVTDMLVGGVVRTFLDELPSEGM